MFRGFLKPVLAVNLCLLVVGCTNIAYYAQAVKGQMQLMAAARPIPEVVNDAATEPELRQQLERIIATREFASSELGLPDNSSYRSYADLGRPFVVWNVFAASEFSVEPRQWCFIFAGCVNYRGYYDKNDADLYAKELREEGADTYIGGVTAYSTLGYFNDPVLNTFLRFGDQETTRIIFHELAHQLIYAKGDSAFNESFATAVENEGMRRWLTQSATPERLRDFEAKQKRKAQFHRLVAVNRDKLRAIYASSLAPDAKRSAKTEVFAEMRRAYADLKASWGGYGGYDQWFNQPLNNASLSSVSLYTQWVPAFHALLEQEEGNLPHFYQRVAALAYLPKTERSAALDQLMPSHTASPEPTP
ncbi:MAG: aminopeptidase [Gallionella sp.]|nr:aminopeptidase [Gallionella sp.]